jgi:SEC-C motif domain protein
MRSRYSAYALDNAAYIMATTHPDNTLYRDDKTAWRTDIETFMRSTRFAGLQILNFEDDTVTFRATLFEGERDISFTEKSLFRQHDGRWLYLSGERE